MTTSPEHVERMRILCRRSFLTRDLEIPTEYERNLSGDFPPRHGDGIVFAAVDDGYFHHFGMALKQSAAGHSPKQCLHLHVYEPSSAARQELSLWQRDDPQHFSFTWDRPGLNPYPPGSPSAPVYFAGARFMRMRQLVTASRSPVFAIDGDSLIRGDLSGLFRATSRTDVGFHVTRRRHMWQRQPPWKTVLAGALLVKPTSAGLRFLSEAAHTVHEALRTKPDGHVDQLTLFNLWRLHKWRFRPTRFQKLSKSLVDWDFDKNSLVWSGKGARKFEASFQGAVSETLTLI